MDPRGTSENLVPLGQILSAREDLEVPDLVPPMNWVPPQRNDVIHDVGNPRSLGPAICFFVEREDVAEFGGVAVPADRLGVLPHVPSIVPRRGAPVLGESHLGPTSIRFRVTSIVALVRFALAIEAASVEPVGRCGSLREIGEG